MKQDRLSLTAGFMPAVIMALLLLLAEGVEPLAERIVGALLLAVELVAHLLLHLVDAPTQGNQKRDCQNDKAQNNI